VERQLVAFVGTRGPNAAQIERCQEAVRAALEAGWGIVTGGAPGIDHLAVLTAQRAGCAERVTLVLPWENFENWRDQRLQVVVFDPREHPAHAEWLAIARAAHPAPDRVKATAWPLLARNVGIVEMADTVFAYPQVVEGRYRGGTAHDIAVARRLDRDLWVDPGTHPSGTLFRDAMVHEHAPGRSREAGEQQSKRERVTPHARGRQPAAEQEIGDREAWMQAQRESARADRAAAWARSQRALEIER
jgi:hypothetical protein